MFDALFVTALLMIINSVLRPLSRYIDRRSLARIETRVFYRLRLYCDTEHQSEAENEVTRAIAYRALVLREVRTEQLEDAANSVVQAVLESSTDDSQMMNGIAERLRGFPWAHSIEWTKTEGEAE
jgi:putative Mg2+ transporter-C (MgtC) family protein